MNGSEIEIDAITAALAEPGKAQRATISHGPN
jgi:hypothetical protein